MLTAQEARDLVVQSEGAVNFYLTKVEPIIRKAIADNKRSAFLYVTDLWDAVETYKRAEPALAQRAVMRKLEALGYGVKFGPDETATAYVPKGLADDDGNGPLYHNVGITINW